MMAPLQPLVVTGFGITIGFVSMYVYATDMNYEFIPYFVIA